MTAEHHKKARWTIIGRHVINNYATRLRGLVGHRKTAHGATHHGWGLDESINYINDVFADFCNYGGLTTAKLLGKTVLEIGAGDNLGVALQLIAAGAQQVVAIDKFEPIRNAKQEFNIYHALRRQYSGVELGRFDSAVDLHAGGVRFNSDKIQYLPGCDVEDFMGRFGGYSVDLIISRAVLMEVQDARGAFYAMNQVLRPDGYSIHKVSPLHDYQMFRGNGYAPLEFLTIPDFVYRQMVSDSGKPSRYLLSSYRTILDELGYNAVFHVVLILGSTAKLPPHSSFSECPDEAYSRARMLIDEIRPRLLRRFQDLPDEDLMVQDFFLVAQKPGEIIS